MLLLHANVQNPLPWFEVLDGVPAVMRSMGSAYSLSPTPA